MLVHLVYLVYLVCLVDRTGNSPRRTRQTRKTGQPDRRARSRCASTEDLQPPSPLLRMSSQSPISFQGEPGRFSIARVERYKCSFQARLFLSLGRAPMLVEVRPSNEALLRARVPGAQDQRGCPSIPFIVRAASKKGTWPLPSHPSDLTHSLFRDGG